MTRDQLRRQHDAATRQLQEMAIARFRKSLKRTLRKATKRIKGSLAASGSGVSADDAALLAAIWAAESDDELMPFLEEVFGAGALAAANQFGVELAMTGPGAGTFVSRRAQQFLAEARNRVAGFGDEMWTQARAQLLEGFTLGEGIAELTGRLTGLFDLLEWQAERIARTEVMDAANQGSLAEMVALGELGPKTKCWLAELDNATDEECAELDGECVSLDAEFSTGDDAPPIHANCRCTLTYGDEPTEDVASATLDELAASAGEVTELPWHVVQDHSQCEASKPWAVVKDADGSVEGCHATQDDAQSQMAALYASENPKGSNMAKPTLAVPPVPPPPAPPKPKTKPVVPVPTQEGTPPYTVQANAVGCPPEASWGVVDAAGVACACSATEEEANEELAELQAPSMTALATEFAEGVAPIAGTPGAFHSLMVIEGVETGDGRIFEPESLTWRTMPIPLKWQRAELPGHDGSVLVGNIERIERQGAEIHGWGVIDVQGADGAECARLIEAGFLRGVSVDVDSVNDADVELVYPDGQSGADGLDQMFMEPEQIRFHAGRVAGLTATPMPAFQEAFIELSSGMAVSGGPPTPEAVPVAPVAHLDAVQLRDELDRIMAFQFDDVSEDLVIQLRNIHGALVPPPPPEPTPLDALVAAAIPVAPPASWFDDPHLEGPTALTVTPEGRVFGHAALLGTCHTSYPGVCVTPPENDDFSAFLLHEIETDDGDLVPVGNITMSGHAQHLGLRGAQEHYDRPDASRAQVNVGYDAYGIWVAGALKSETTPAQVRDLRAAALSGEWRRIGGRYRLIALAAVNVPGFPIPRTSARVEKGLQTSLVASAGLVPGRSLDRGPDLGRVVERLAKSVGRDRETRVAAMVARVKGV